MASFQGCGAAKNSRHLGRIQPMSYRNKGHESIHYIKQCNRVRVICAGNLQGNNSLKISVTLQSQMLQWSGAHPHDPHPSVPLPRTGSTPASNTTAFALTSKMISSRSSRSENNTGAIITFSTPGSRVSG